ncbi:uroporphyrinogen-III synthase [Hydrogenimonas sp.]
MENERPQNGPKKEREEEISLDIYLLSPTSRPGVRHLPMIQFETIPQAIDFSGYDGLVLTSKQGVVALDEVSGGTWRETPVAAIGKMTAREVEKRGGRVIYIATKAYGDVLAKELAEHFPRYRWLYTRPKVVVSKIAKDLRDAGVEVDEKIVYETSCKKYAANEKPMDGAVLIFTAPSIVRCFFKNFPWNESWKAVAIGEKTAQAFPEGVAPEISPSTSIDDAILFSKNSVLH